MLNFMLQLMRERNIRFTQADRAACEPLARHAAELAYLRPDDTALCAGGADGFYENAAMLTQSGLEPQALRKALSYLLLSCDAIGGDLFKKFIIAEALLCRQRGLSPYAIHLNVGIMLGKSEAQSRAAANSARRERAMPLEEFYRIVERNAEQRVEEHYANWGQNSNLEHDANRKREAPGELEAWLLRASAPAVQRLLREVENAALTLSLHGMGVAASRKIMEAVSSRIQSYLIEDYLRRTPARDAIDEAVESVLRVLRRLIEHGEVISDKR